jgi:hypothetical protein
MGTFLHFHVKTEDKESLIRILKERSGLENESTILFPEYILDNPVYDMTKAPDLLAINQLQNGWISILHNGFAKLYDWGILFSKVLNTTFIQVIGQENSDYYYFLYYFKGELLREIEVDSMQLTIFTDFGKKFSFEKTPILTDDFDDETNFFSIDTLEFYCKEFGVDIPALYKSQSFTLLKNQ